MQRGPVEKKKEVMKDVAWMKNECGIREDVRAQFAFFRSCPVRSADRPTSTGPHVITDSVTCTSESIGNENGRI
jgi:hypothetical protein